MNTLLGYLILVAAILYSGYLSWTWVEPDSFGGAILFLFVWALLGTIAKYIIAMIFASSNK